MQKHVQEPVKIPNYKIRSPKTLDIEIYQMPNAVWIFNIFKEDAGYYQKYHKGQ